MSTPLVTVVVAQAGDFLDSLKPYGIAGICLAFFMMRDVWRETRDAKRSDERENQRAVEMQELRAAIRDCAGAMNHLTRAISTEVLTRPNVEGRTAADMRELQELVSKG
jgi:hypothetical protein